ncbi:type VI secretion system tip protein VgrG [Pseudenhygromyxa sp. WMMC2535]|uniref:type VI secretion system Vgr family protein n=1 Tax=Pseudenhygromyxa sp. WMMC2535 TaxID=2712867 RepID=UPI0015526AF7|nr:type VI secretion system tip protein TssI/VgrG [Pseudenhygromyxa sp. WMMC2535]NVB39018.1 type VI secretion system tip protein VgrG [Pseudenhygromyxa sp. WMMC2535]
MAEQDYETPVTLRFESDVEGSWQVLGLLGWQRFNEPYELAVSIATADLMAEPDELLGASVNFVLERLGLVHELSGIVERVEDGRTDDHHLFATLTVVPAVVALMHRVNNRIFQDMSVPEILEQVLGEGLAPYGRELDLGYLSGVYEPQEYTVQFRETDFDFASRLMEEYGIVYHFVSADGKEVMTLSDSDGVCVDLRSFGNQDGMVAMTDRDADPGLHENVYEFRRKSKLRSTVARTRIFDWLDPSRPVEVENADSVELDTLANGAQLEPEREEYDYQEPSTMFGHRSAGLSSAAVEAQMSLRRGLQQRDAIRCQGKSTVSGMAPAVQFELLDHPQLELNSRYTVIAVEHAFGSCAGGLGVGAGDYANRFECIPAAYLWKPERRRPRPRVHGMQTATVVGPAGEEIHTDAHGRIKVQFHWDREGGYDEHSSCFIRVVQPWAGNGWGFVFLPRIGMEVAVTFVGGDLDRPVVTGCLYNGDHATPYPLPDDKTKSTIKTESSPGGGGFNELRFEDAAGAEEIFIHAQKDFNEVVLNDHNTTVGNNQTNNVDVDQTQTVHGNQSETVDGNQDMTVGGNRLVHVVGDFEEAVDGAETRTVTGDVTETLLANETRDITANQTETIGGNVTHTITGDQTDTITGSLSQTITAGVTVTTPATYEVTADGGITMTASAGIKMVAPAGFQVVAPGGTTTVDSFFDKHGGKSTDAFGFKMSVVGAKTDIVAALALSLVNNKVDIVGLKMDIAGSVFKGGRQTTIQSLGMAIMQGYVNLKCFGLISIV